MQPLEPHQRFAIGFAFVCLFLPLGWLQTVVADLGKYPPPCPGEHRDPARYDDWKQWRYRSARQLHAFLGVVRWFLLAWGGLIMAVVWSLGYR